MTYWSFHGVIIFYKGYDQKISFENDGSDLLWKVSFHNDGSNFPRPIPITITLNLVVFICYFCSIKGAVAFHFPQFFFLFFFFLFFFTRLVSYSFVSILLFISLLPTKFGFPFPFTFCYSIFSSVLQILNFFLNLQRLFFDYVCISTSQSRFEFSGLI